ncbi:mitochondrial ornithine carrier protein [Rhizina undulata]
MSQDFGMIEANSAAAAEAAKGSEIAALAAVKDILFGSIAGMVGKVIEYPFDTVKVRLQSQPDDRPLRYRGPLDCFKQSLQQGGIRGLYRGISPPLVGAAAENSALFFSYNLAQKFARQTSYSDLSPETALPMNALVMCGAASGAFASFILTPIELVKCKMQVQAVGISGATTAASHALSSPARHAGPITLLGEIYRVYGIRGLWHGQMGTFLRETGGSAAWFGAYEYASKSLREWRGRKDLAPGEMMMAGAAAGVSYNFVLFPADSVKSRMQTEAIGIRGEKSKGFFTVAKGMYRAGGLSSLYRGCGITCLRSAPSSAIIFLVYESMKAYF